MAIKPIIYKFRIALSDIERNLYESLNITVARHPSETMQRMMVRVLALAINYDDDLKFTRGLSATDEPDLWKHSADDSILLWIDVGEPSPERVKKASRQASDVKVYSFNTKADVWWNQNRDLLSIPNVSVISFDNAEISKLTTLVDRTTDCSITISDNSAIVASNTGSCEIGWLTRSN